MNRRTLANRLAVAILLITASVAPAQELPPSLPERILSEPVIPASPPVREAGPPSGMGLGGGPMGGLPGYDATWYPIQSLSNRPGELGLVRQGLRVGAPVWRSDSGNMLMANIGVRHTLFQTDALLPDTGRAFPDQLWSLNFGLNYLHQFENGWTGMLMSGFGSASDRPFHSLKEVTATLGGFVTIPAANGRDRWQVGAIYLYGGPVNFPLPMIAYQWNPSERLRVNVGLPLSVNWRPTDDWEFTASYTPLFNITARLTYTVTPGVQVYGGYEYLNESYFLFDRLNNRDRFFVLEQRVIGGVRLPVRQAGAFELNAGYSFGRFYGEGDNQWGRLRDRVDVEPGPFLGVRFSLRF